MHKDMTRDEFLFWRMIDDYCEPDALGPSNCGLQYYGRMPSTLSRRLQVGFFCCSKTLTATIYIDSDEDETLIDGIPNDGWEVAERTFSWDSFGFDELIFWMEDNGRWEDVVRKYKDWEY